MKKLTGALHEVWDHVPESAKHKLTEAGFKAKAASEQTQETGDIMSLLKQHVESLPDPIKLALQEPEPTKTQAGFEASHTFKQATGKLRDLGHRKLQLQSKIDVAKESLRDMLTELQALQAQIDQTQQEVNRITKEYEAKVLAQAEGNEVHAKAVCEKSELSTLLAHIGVTLTEEQQAKLKEMTDSQDNKRRKVEKPDVEMPLDCERPPGLQQQG